MRRVPALLVPAFALVAGAVPAVAPGTAAAHWSYLLAFAVIVGLAWVRLRTLRGPTRSGYALIVGALSVWLAGDVLYDVLSRVTTLGEVSPSDLLWISGYPLLAAGLIRLTQLRAPGRLREGLLDGLVMAIVMAWLCWQFIILPAAEHERLSLQVAVAAFYPFGDVLLFAAIAVLVLAPGTKRGPTPYLMAALALTLIGDVGISTLPELFPSLSRSLQAERLDGVLLLANSLLVAALVHRDAGRIADRAAREQRLHPARVVFLGAALLVLPTMAGLRSFESTLSRVSLIVSVVLMTTLILVRFVFVVREQERIRAALAHQAEHDQLTGLANRPALRSRLELLLSGSREDPYGPVLFYLDLNGFKQVNDKFGHAAGDFVLVEFARRLVAALRPGDVAARLGGDEFVVLAEEVPGEPGARALAERLRALAAEPVRRGEESYPIGVSVGWAAAAQHPEAEALLAAADAEMFADKTLTAARTAAAGLSSSSPAAALILPEPTSAAPA
ncbi:GGDEF domain-containing protein [Paractinoplanes lichenicola]|uniref:GGDEF domain-containing protein n=1 Tax=Paractinoplanes lichenicola TaxID=2802976 RepID=A0ABS1VPL9_9ACTN|nr:GGDEF domain-containing protein [Actinoplanes lichenicola]MBL7256676.1 GGDEF domain-containing protein [Actinoplanes lichenicola]